MKAAVRVRAPVSMDAVVQQTESLFTAKVLHFPLPTKFRMPHIEAFDGTKDPVDHLNTYKNQMELHGNQDPVRCRAFASTLKGSALAWFNRLLLASVSFFKLHCFRVPLYRSLDVPEAELPPANRKAKPLRKLEVLHPEVQLEVTKGGHPG